MTSLDKSRDEIMKLNSHVASFAFALSLMTPVAAFADSSPRNNDQFCLIIAGCSFNITTGKWNCPDPQTYVDCKVSDGGG